MIKWQEVIPVLISIGIIISVAILQRQSKVIAAITATMPINIPLALWIVYTSVGGDRKSMADFSLGMLLGGIPTLAFLIVTWLTVRSGLKLEAVLLLGYSAWSVMLLALIGLRKLFGW
jgi:hypothetical protein